MGSGEIDSRHRAGGTSLLWLGAALGYFVAAASTIHLTSNGRDIATIWPANAILVALLLADARPRWRTVLSAGFIGNLAANLITRGTLAGPILYGIANLVEVWVAARFLHAGHRQGSFLTSTGRVMRFILIAGLIAPTISGVLGSLTAMGMYGEPLQKSFLTWVAADGLGLLVFTPFLSAMLRGDFVACFRSKTWRERAEALGLLSFIGMIDLYVFFSAPKPILFAIFPPLLLITFRVGRLGTKAGVMLTAVIGGLATMQGHGPITLLAAESIGQAHFFQAFLAVTLLTCLPAAAEVNARNRHALELAQHDRQMTIAARHDPLTGVLNRAGFDAAAGLLLQSAAAPASVIAIDFDHFKRINDQWGHQAGDRALKHVTGLLQASLRTHDLVARIGGDEFVVLLPSGDRALAINVAERIQASVQASPLVIDDTSVALLSLSMGVATRRDGAPLDELMRQADLALYDAKKAGRATMRQAG